MNDSHTLLEHFFFNFNFHAPYSLYDWFDCSTQTVVGELTEVGQRLVVAVGGLGGKGNAALRTKGACCHAAVLHWHCTALSLRDVMGYLYGVLMTKLWVICLSSCYLLHRFPYTASRATTAHVSLLLLLILLILDHSLTLCTAALPVCFHNR